MSAAKRVLIADEDAAVRLMLSKVLGELGHQVRATTSIATILNWVSKEPADLAIIDAADEESLETLQHIRRLRPKLPVILTSGQGTLLTAVRAVKAGAFDHLAKPLQSEAVLSTALRAFARAGDGEALRTQARAIRADRLPLIGGSSAMQDLYRNVARLVDANLTVLILGESGVGKALVARALHDMGPRRDGEFVSIDLAAMRPDAIEAELFGQEPGELGKLAKADGGTLFLDSIGDLPADSQTRLLRVIDGTERAPHGRVDSAPNVRFVAAANCDLRERVRQGLFREDLFFRLNVAPVRIPPLRARPDDIADLARAFLLRASRAGAPKTLDRHALERLREHDWPGNVRELENLIRRICALYADDLITGAMVARELAEIESTAQAGPAQASLSEFVERRLSAYFAGQPLGVLPTDLYSEVLAEVERPLIQATLAATAGNQIQAAGVLGINRNTLRRKMQDHGIAARRGEGAVPAPANDTDPARPLVASAAPGL